MPHILKWYVEILLTLFVFVILNLLNLHQPSGSQAAAMAIEDAATLGALFSDLADRRRLPALLGAYEDIRQPRCAAVLVNERQRTDFVSFPRGDPNRTARDAGFQEAMAADVLELEEADEVVVSSNLGDYVTLWAHNALEEVEDWRVKWGKILETSSGGQVAHTRGRSVTIHLQVMKETKTTNVDLVF
jgi:hypothetical protein